MSDFLLALLHLAVTTARLGGPGGVRAIIAENLLLKHQLIVLRRGRRRAPNLTRGDRLLFGFGSLFLTAARVRRVRHRVPPINASGVASGARTAQVPTAVLSDAPSKEAGSEGARRSAHPSHR